MFDRSSDRDLAADRIERSNLAFGTFYAAILNSRFTSIMLLALRIRMFEQLRTKIQELPHKLR